MSASERIYRLLSSFYPRRFLRDYREPMQQAFRDQLRGSHPLDAPGSQDITCDVAFDQLRLDRPAVVTTQAEFLRRNGIEELVEQGRALWNERAHIADLAAVRGRSTVREAEALLDLEGLGAFRVLSWESAQLR